MIGIGDLLDRQSSIFDALRRRHADLVRYAYTIRSLRSLNVLYDQAYQRTFNGLYMVRRNGQWRTHFYELLETQKSEKNVSFKAMLSDLHARTGRIEASFASKLLATINPELPVYDSIVRKNLGLPNRAAGISDRVRLLEQDYIFIQEHSQQQRKSQGFQELRETFDEKIPEFRSFSDTKVLDLLIWQVR